ncbi:MAG: hypothetical protein J6W52_10510 [Bacteroidaceae bacterium]|nr:hypothetical protein [Bacteroidaceae bacterium]
MDAKTFYKTLAILLGYGLIIGGFTVFGSALETKVRILDIIVSLLVYTQLIQFLIYPLIDVRNPAHKEVGMMGIHFGVLGTYCIFAIGIMVFGIIADIPFGYQLMAQLVIIFLALLGRVATLFSGENVQRIYEKEQQQVKGKKMLGLVMNDLMDALPRAESLESSCVQKLQDIQEALRYLTPSASEEARQYEADFCRTAEDLKVLMRNTDLNGERIKEAVGQLERILSRRKKINS